MGAHLAPHHAVHSMMGSVDHAGDDTLCLPAQGLAHAAHIGPQTEAGILSVSASK